MKLKLAHVGTCFFTRSAFFLVYVFLGEFERDSRAESEVVAWGLNDYGQTNVPSGLSNVVAVAAGRTHSSALRSDGTVVGWPHDGPLY
ncbi:MAG: RCC1 domain-containing protein [Candidatus Omnitrophica bacterium]|nr:RCC1 domain-containing protein [Candidatus Omnitrophota bacterium]